MFEKGMEILQDFMNKIAGPAAEEFGLALQDKAKLYRYKNLLKILEKAKKYAEESNSDIREIPLRTLIPMFEGASLENNENLADKWAALIANAATRDSIIENHPSYAQILREMSPNDALLLDAIYKKKQALNWQNFKEKYSIENSLTLESVAFSYYNLFRLGLIHNSSKGLIKSEFSRHFMRACKI